MKTILFFTVACLLTLTARANQELFFVGSGRTNIEAFRLDDTSGAVTPVGTVAQIAVPSFLAVSPNHRFLYAVTEGRTAKESSVSAFSINNETGQLILLNNRPDAGSGPCHIEVDRSGHNALIANYNSGSVAVYPIDSSGALGPASAFVQDSGSSINKARQEGPHAHCIVTDPRNHFAYVCDLGLDKVMIFKFDSKTGSLAPASPPFVAVIPGTGPRHIAFHPTGRWAYVINELSSSVTAFSCKSKTGELSAIQTLSLLPADFAGSNTGAEVAVDRSGNFVYCSNRGDNSIVLFSCDRKTGQLTFADRVPCGGKTPRQFMIDPSGNYLLAAAQDSNLVTVFRIDRPDGRLEPTGVIFRSNEPECVQFQ